MSQAGEFRFYHPLRVRWTECDLQGIVFFGRYYEYFDLGMTEYLRNLGFTYPAAFTDAGGDLFIKHSHCDYAGSAVFDDELDVGTRIAGLGRSSIVFDFRVARAGEALATGEIVYVFADPEARTSMALPEDFRAAVRAFEFHDPEGAT